MHSRSAEREGGGNAAPLGIPPVAMTGTRTASASWGTRALFTEKIGTHHIWGKVTTHTTLRPRDPFCAPYCPRAAALPRQNTSLGLVDGGDLPFAIASFCVARPIGYQRQSRSGRNQPDFPDGKSTSIWVACGAASPSLAVG